MYSTSLLKLGLKIKFTKEEATSIYQPHNDTLVVVLTIANIKVYKILVDGGSSTDVVSLAVRKDRLKSSLVPLAGFGGEQIIPEGSIEQPIAMLERLALHILRVVLSTYHHVTKFPTLQGVEVVKREQ